MNDAPPIENFFSFIAGRLPDEYGSNDRAKIIAINTFPIFLIPLLVYFLIFVNTKSSYTLSATTTVTYTIKFGAGFTQHIQEI
ncbi:MAG: hypothetical protein RIA69_13485 [Cyclobacteriaceae bacterium]